MKNTTETTDRLTTVRTHAEENRKRWDAIHADPFAPSPSPLALFSVGQVITTPGAASALESGCPLNWEMKVQLMVKRHVTGQFGRLDAEDTETNLRAIAEGGRVISSYLVAGSTFNVITEAGGRCTTVLLPDEY